MTFCSPRALLLSALLLATGSPAAAPPTAHEIFATSDDCIACHRDLVTPTGRDVSIATDWSATMMANSARDPYWQAAVRREVMDHPQAQARIEDECSACHMPMARYAARAAGARGRVFTHLPFGPGDGPAAALAEDGVSCTLCHQIQPDNLGTESSFTAGFLLDDSTPPGERPIFGPFRVDEGRKTIMRSAARFEPTRGEHVQRSELCASCHTLYTHTRGPDGEVIATLPEQMPYLEWRHSEFADRRSCQDCHMAEVEQAMAITPVLGAPREGLSQHLFRGGNFFMMRMLNRYRDELAVTATTEALENAAQQTVRHLQTASAELAIAGADIVDGRLDLTVSVANLAGHKLPSAYPSRRAWLHLSVQNRHGAVVFESGRFRADGAIAGNDNDRDPHRYEPHHSRITRADQVQIYEGILAAPDGAVTTGLLTASRYVKDSRLLPRGFDKATAADDIAVQGRARRDEDFTGGGDRVRYVVEVDPADGPFEIRAALWYQPIAYRWAHNLAPYDAPETRRFVRYYRAMAAESALVLAEDRAVATP